MHSRQQTTAAKAFDYAGADGQKYHLQRELPEIAEGWVGQIRAAKIQPWIQHSDSVFEYGVGFGWNLMSLQCREKTGFDVVAQLKSPVEAKNIRFIADLASISGERYDVVICHHTLEHVKNPSGVLEHIETLLKPSGRLLLYVPFEKERKYRKPNPNDQAHHLFSWTPSSLHNLLQANGFNVSAIRLQRFRFDRAAAIAACKLKLGESGCRIIRSLALFIFPEYEIAAIANKL